VIERCVALAASRKPAAKAAGAFEDRDAGVGPRERGGAAHAGNSGADHGHMYISHLLREILRVHRVPASPWPEV
jgi:hypothetical protein